MLFNAPLPDIMRKSKAVMLSKVNSRVAEPRETRMIVINTLPRRIVEKTIHEYVKDDLWLNIGTY